ncbi:MAG: Threonine synthase [Methanoregulaceae archaeon PtaU1.Bin222]|nr:MAG: Threonine synthase [Methanoregulaceae archaeon PtaU1.Bin222]
METGNPSLVCQGRILNMTNAESFPMVTLAEIQAASLLLEGKVIRTPLVYSPTFSGMSGAEVYLKLETMQKAGSFKVRGAANRILSSAGELGTQGVIAASAGNHAQGVAVAASMAGVPATIIMPEWVSLAKQEATLAYGAKVILKGSSLEETIGEALAMAEQGHMTFIHPYNDPLVIAGQGTIGLEILEDLPETDLVVVPVGGGGLISGIATAVKSLRTSARIVGVQAQACPSALSALGAGIPTTVEAQPTIADGIRVKRIGDLAFPVMKDLVDEVVLVDEQAIVNAILTLLERKKVLSEGAGAAPLAALLSHRVRIQEGEHVVLLISGGNVDTFLLERILKKGLYASGRMVQLRVPVEDEAQSISLLLETLARQGAVINQIGQERSAPDLPVHQMRVILELEVRGRPHLKGLIAALNAAGFPVQPFPGD